MKTIKRLNLDTNQIEEFINTGVWADGHLAYAPANDEQESVYVQIRSNGKLCMMHV